MENFSHYKINAFDLERARPPDRPDFRQTTGIYLLVHSALLVAVITVTF